MTREEIDKKFPDFCEEAKKDLMFNLPVTGTKGTNIIKTWPDGHEEIIGHVKPDILVKEKEIYIK